MSWTWAGWSWTTEVNVAENCPTTWESISTSTRGMQSSSTTLSLFFKKGLVWFLRTKISHLLHLMIALRRSKFAAWLVTELSWEFGNKVHPLDFDAGQDILTDAWGSRRRRAQGKERAGMCRKVLVVWAAGGSSTRRRWEKAARWEWEKATKKVSSERGEWGT